MKTIFIDMDGTIADINFDTHPEDVYEEGFFKNKRPCNDVINAIRNVFKDNNKLILSASPNDNTDFEKIKWLEKNFPEISTYGTNTLFIRYPKDDKVDALIKICSFKGLDPRKDVILIDDDLNILRKASSLGITAIHPTRVLIMNEECRNQ